MWRARCTGRFTLFVKPCQEYWFAEKKLLSTLQRIIGRFMGHKTKGDSGGDWNCTWLQRWMNNLTTTARWPPRTFASVRMFPFTFPCSLFSFFFQPMRSIERESTLCPYRNIKKQHGNSVSIRAPCPPVLKNFWRCNKINWRSSEDHVLLTPLAWCTVDHLNTCSGVEGNT